MSVQIQPLDDQNQSLKEVLDISMRMEKKLKAKLQEYRSSKPDWTKASMGMIYIVAYQDQHGLHPLDLDYQTGKAKLGEALSPQKFQKHIARKMLKVKRGDKTTPKIFTQLDYWKEWVKIQKKVVLDFHKLFKGKI